MKNTDQTPCIATLLYHDVCEDPRESGFQRSSALPYKHSNESFIRNLDRISAGPVRPALVDGIDFSRPGKHLLLTFDDGGRSAERVCDELCRRKWKAHFLVTTSLIGTRTFLDPDGIRHIRACGHIVGSHSHTHPDIYKDLSPSRMAEEWRISRDILAQILGEPCEVASVPGGDISPLVLQSAGIAGIRFLFTSEPVLTPVLVQECWVLGRAGIKNTTPVQHVEELVRFESWRKEWAVRRCSVLARSMFHPLYRWYVRRTTASWKHAT